MHQNLLLSAIVFSKEFRFKKIVGVECSTTFLYITKLVRDMRWTLVLLGLLLLTGCVSQTPIDPNAPLKEFELVVKQFAFEPAVVTVEKGDHVKLYITNADVTHGISIPAFHVSTRLDPKKVNVVEFSADKVGMFEFRCNVFCGSGHGKMLGAIEVVEAK